MFDGVDVVVHDFVCSFFFFNQKTAYDVRISDWSSDVCSSDLLERQPKMGQTGRRDSVGFLPRPHRSYRRVHQACHFSSTPDFVEYVSNVDCHNRMYANIARYFQAERCDMSNKLQQGTTSAGVFSVCPDRRFALSEGMDRGYT